MNTTTRDRRLPKALVVGSIAAGLAAGSYGIASAAGNDSGAGSSQATGGAAADRPGTPAPPGHPCPAGGGPPWGGQRSDETVLPGDTASKVEAAAKSKVPGGTVVRVETDADGHANYEAHMTDADGAPVTVYVDDRFDVVSVERR
ncbi:MAG TPA: hypothetical protein VFI83_09305 [Gaiella sp.]|jgi:hypothetical protein|nr:hypothetical protein [Gaiella sp.]